MCLILFAYRVHPDYPLVMAANRDEFYDRPTAPVHRWTDFPQVLAGRDLLKDGTWMGVASGGRYAALTNYRDPGERTDGMRSRGQLVSDYLTGCDSPGDYAERASRERTHFPGYNLLIGDLRELYYYSNVSHTIRELEPGVYGVSNHLLDTDWPKVERGKRALREQLSHVREDRVEGLFALLEDTEPAPDDRLPATGVALEWERLLSPIYIRSERYGTRSSTVLLLGERQLHYVERTRTVAGVQDRKYTLSY
ncbi:NRDE family protein [Paenibacillus sp.]|uniref:NRDE family protein n=1 Tax=Paenibacillus sp. TaxID=58172 RepID=UPI002D622131|nr:NRDE family protein [Paenibacillus sp.]HZG57063.1 NRDE family protein [Paenibacillus sp.]